jgi:hypothetical protein
MDIIDLNTISRRALHLLRIRVVAAVENGMTKKAASRRFGVSRYSVTKWVAASLEGLGGSLQEPRIRNRGGIRAQVALMRTLNGRSASAVARERLLTLGATYERTGDLARATAAYAVANRPAKAEELSEAERQGSQRGRSADAVLSSTHTVRTASRTALARIARRCVRQGHLTAAVEAYAGIGGDEAVSNLLTLGRSCEGAGKFLSAIRAYGACRTDAARTRLVEMGDTFEDYDYAIEAYAHADTEDARARLLILGDQCLKEQDLDHARWAYQAAAADPIIVSFADRWVTAGERGRDLAKYGVLQYPGAASMPKTSLYRRSRRNIART